MCDTFVILPDASENGHVIFGKNSDREPNEAHQVVMFPAQDFTSGSEVRCTYRSIPQVSHIHAVMLLKPFWIWGAEMGANEKGVVIGNEAVFTKEKAEKGLGLIGMDYIRLALERASSADEALQVMVDLLGQYGQGGNCGFTHPFFYQNSFIIADSSTAWVLETSGREWAAEKVSGVRSISNAITIGQEWTKQSPTLVKTAVERGWSKNEHDFNFARDYSEPIYTTFSAAHHRQACTTGLLQARQSKLTVKDAMAVLRSHATGKDGNYRPDIGLMGAEVCMHAGWGPIRNSQSVGSLVAEIAADNQIFWVTGTSAPCTSIFKPVWFSSGIPWQDEPGPTGKFDSGCLWWRHEQVHRQILQNYPELIARIRADQARLEDEALDWVNRRDTDPVECLRISNLCFTNAESAEQGWLKTISDHGANRNRFYYKIAWRGFNQQAAMTPELAVI